MKGYSGINSEYPFDIPIILCPSINDVAKHLNTTISKMREWEIDGDVPTRSKSSAHHGLCWTMDEAKEAFIKGYILLRKGQ